MIITSCLIGTCEPAFVSNIFRSAAKQIFPTFLEDFRRNAKTPFDIFPFFRVLNR